MQAISIIFICIVIVTILAILVRPKKAKKIPTPDISPISLGKLFKPKNGTAPTGGYDPTRVIPDIIVQQLNVDSKGRVTGVAKEIEISKSRIPASGYLIGKMDLEPTQSASTVSSPHLAIGFDEEGFFAKDKNSLNGTRLLDEALGVSHNVKSFDIDNGTVVCLGTQWIRFVIPEFELAPSFDFNGDDDFEDFDHDADESVLRRG